MSMLRVSFQRSRPALSALFLLMVWVACPPTQASAQYMYVDANGDGVHTGADVLAPSGTTTFDVWIVTNANRDATAATCPTGEPLTIFSYEFILRATNGFMNWGPYTNLQAGMATSFGSQSSSTEFYAGFGGSAILPPGTYRLGTLEASPALGTPALDFVAAPATLQASFLTAFGSQCPGHDEDYTMKLGADWFDADGADYGGSSQAPPELAPLADMTVSEGAVAEQGLSAVDSDGQPLQFEKANGPVYMTVATTDPGTGTAHGVVTLAPGAQSAGVAVGEVRVTDGLATDEDTFGITVLPVNFPPAIQAPQRITIAATATLHLLATSSDPDGDPVTLIQRDRASFMPGYGFPVSSRVDIDLYPGTGDVGDWFVFLEATDGILTSNTAVPLHVEGNAIAPAPPDGMFLSAFRGHELIFAPVDLATGDLDGDGMGDLALVSDAGGFIEWMRGDARGHFMDAGRLAAHAPVSLKLGDLNGDGVLDVLYTDRADGTLSVVLGPVLGQAPSPASYPALPNPSALSLGDFDGDGALDALVAGRTTSDLLLFLNDGSGALRAPRIIPIPAPTVSMAVGDVNGDGALDVAVVHETPHSLSLHRNVGDGTFLAPITRQYAPTPPFSTAPGAVAMADLNRDGRDDVVTWIRAGIQVYMTDPAGDLLPAVGYAGTGMTAIHLTDISGDGILDLIACGAPDDTPPGIHYRKGVGDGTFLANMGLQFFGRPMKLVTLDFDAEGDRDVVVASEFRGFIERISGALALYRNEGDGRFGQEIVSEGLSIQGRSILVDVNADGHLDVAGSGGVHLGRGDGTFGPVIGSTSSGIEDVIIPSDLNRDGHIDLVVASQGSVAATVKLGDGTGHFTTTEAVGFSLPATINFALGDFNGDGIPDILAGSLYYDQAGPRTMQIRLGLGDGTFGPEATAPLIAAVTSIQVLDFEGDGDLDALVGDFYYNDVKLLEGHGDGTFEAARIISTSFAGTGALTLGDLDGNGLFDIVTREFQWESSISVIRQITAGSFTNPWRTWTTGGFPHNIPIPMSLADLDLDGRLDLVAGTHGSVVVGIGDGLGGFGRRAFFGHGGAVPMVGDVNEDGWPDIVVNGGDYAAPPAPLRTLLNQLGRPREARAFITGNPTIHIGAQGHTLCLRVEPVGGSYENTSVDLTGFTLRSDGTGAVDVIRAVTNKRTVLGDFDRNGIQDLGVCFAPEDVSALFSQITGRVTVNATLEGRLNPSGRFQAPVTLTVLGTAPTLSPSLSPNPLNPAGMIRFATTRPGAARIRLFDVRGRMVRDLLDRTLEAGDHAIPFDGKDQAGRGLASGIYFATIDDVEGLWRIRVAILK